MQKNGIKSVALQRSVPFALVYRTVAVAASLQNSLTFYAYQ